jgi:predicted nucleic acid-binding Zn finger protein
MKENTATGLTLSEARMLANIHTRADQLYNKGYRVRPTDSQEVLAVDSPTGGIYWVNTNLKTCTCPFFTKYNGDYSCKHVLGIARLLCQQYGNQPQDLWDHVKTVARLKRIVRRRNRLYQCQEKEDLAEMLGLRYDTFHHASWQAWAELKAQQFLFWEDACLQYALFKGYPFPGECPEFGLLEPDYTDLWGQPQVSTFQRAVSYRRYLERLGESPETIFLHIKEMPEMSANHACSGGVIE